MISVLVNGKPQLLRSSWGDFTFGDFISFSEMKSETEMLSFLTGFSERQINLLSDESIAVLTSVLSFASTLPVSEKVEIVFGKKSIASLGECSYGQRVNLGMFLSENPNRIDAVLHAAAVYCEKDFEGNSLQEKKLSLKKCNFEEIYCFGSWVLDEFEKIIIRENELLKSNTKPEERQAGVDSLHKFGEFALIDALAGGDVLKYENILKMDYDTVFTKLLYNKELSDYREKLSNIISRKNG